MPNRRIKNWQDYRPLTDPNGPGFGQILSNPDATYERHVFLEAFYSWLNPDFRKGWDGKPAADPYVGLAEEFRIKACAAFKDENALPTSHQVCVVADVLIWEHFFIQFMGVDPSAVPYFPWLDNISPPDIDSHGLCPFYMMWYEANEATMDLQKMAAEDAAAEKLVKDEEATRQGDGVLKWVDFRPVDNPRSPPFGDVLKDPAMMSQRRAFLSSYFRWLSPEFRMTDWIELAAHFELEVMEYFRITDVIPTRDQLWFFTDILIWHGFFEIYLGVAPDDVPEWPWMEYQPPGNVEEEGISKTFLEYVTNKLTEGMSQLSVDQEVAAGPSDAAKGILDSLFAPKSEELKESKGKAPVDPVAKAKQEDTQSWVEE